MGTRLPLDPVGSSLRRRIGEDVDRIDPAHWTIRWQRHLYGVYALLLIASGYVLIDALLPLRTISARIEEAHEMSVNVSSEYDTHANYSYWTLVKLDNGVTFQTENGASEFPTGGTMDVEVTALRNEVVRYKPPNNGRSGWYEVEGANREYLAFPAAVVILALLLLIPWWSLENRWLLHGIMVLVLVAWLLTLLGTGVMRSLW